MLRCLDSVKVFVLEVLRCSDSVEMFGRCCDVWIVLRFLESFEVFG